jgi:hypothetical protein
MNFELSLCWRSGNQSRRKKGRSSIAPDLWQSVYMSSAELMDAARGARALHRFEPLTGLSI